MTRPRRRDAAARTAAGLALGLLAAAVAPRPVRAAGLRGDVTFTAATLDYRTVVRDSLPESEVPGDGTTRTLADGTVVTCVPGGFCYWYRAGKEKNAHPMTQDLRLTGWPGWTGVSARAHLRGRVGSDDFWPRSTERVELVTLEVDVERGDFRLRGGRQATQNGLGAYDFDGAHLLWRRSPRWQAAAYGGLSLGRTLLQSHTGSLLEDNDLLAPDRRSILLGLEGRVQLSPGWSAAAAYQRELRTDRYGLYSERIALDSRWFRGRRALEFSGRFDLAFAQFNLARLRVTTPVAKSLDFSLEGRHSAPFFELWTIWGAFSPVGFNEARGALQWRARPDLALDAALAYRGYDETHVGGVFAPIEGDGLRWNLGANWTRAGWVGDARASVNRGFGAYRGALDVSVGRELNDTWQVSALAQGTQQFAEFRFGDGRTVGLGGRARYTHGRVRGDANLALYRHTYDHRPGYADFNQLRGQVSLTVGFGSEPGARPAVGGLK